MTVHVGPPGKPGALPLADIQGNILTAYGRIGFPKARYLVVNLTGDPTPASNKAGRNFIRSLFPLVTTAIRWKSHKLPHFGPGKPIERPKVTLNLAFSFWGLYRLGLSTRVLENMPNEFAQGMAARAIILGDSPDGTNITEAWDPVWKEIGRHPQASGHILIMLSAQMDNAGNAVPELDEVTARIQQLCAESGGLLELMKGHNADGSGEWQDMSALMDELEGEPVPNAKEHFGFTDSISDPVFEGQYPPDVEAVKVRGNGKFSGGEWKPLATGEFLLGYPDGAQEIPMSRLLRGFARNGTFIAYRKLQQNVVSFRTWVEQTAPEFGKTFRISDPVAARETLMAKIAGRWPDGAPLTLYPDYEAWLLSAQASPDTLEGRRELTNYLYFDDPIGAKCPLTSHTRRNNPRDGNGPVFGAGNSNKCGTVLTDRRRILRRGVPYGVCPPDAKSEGEHGIVILILCADLGRQFEFMQQQWVNYGVDANSGNDTDPLIGLRGTSDRFIIPANPDDGHAPFFAKSLPQFVETRGGDYYFMPSMSALSLLAMGVIDPT